VILWHVDDNLSAFLTDLIDSQGELIRKSEFASGSGIITLVWHKNECFRKPQQESTRIESSRDDITSLSHYEMALYLFTGEGNSSDGADE
jgi:hypothetical protein